MPSVATGLGLDLVLAGSKASIFTSAFAAHNNGSKTHQKSGADYLSTSPSQVVDLNKGLLGKTVFRDHLLGITNGGLPNLMHRPARTDVNGANGKRRDSSIGPPTLQYTNRQKHLLENEGNKRTDISPNLNKPILLDSQRRKESGSRKSGISLLQPDSPTRVTLTRPRSSQLELSNEKFQSGREHVQRHASETRISQEKETESSNFQDSGSFDPAKIHIKSPETLNWNLSPPDRDKSHSRPSEKLNFRLRLRPAAPEPDDVPSLSPRSARSDCSSDTDQILSANREIIEIVAKENKAFKNELTKSLNRLWERAVRSAGPVSGEEVQNLQAEFEKSSFEQTSPNRGSPRSKTPRNTSAEVLYTDPSCRKTSLHSDDSGISSETIERQKINGQTGSFKKHSPRLTADNERSFQEKQNPAMLADDPFNVLKTKRKKSSKSRKRKSGKRTGKKSRHDSSASSHKKKTKDPSSTKNNVREPTPNNKILNFQAYCSPMQVLPASFKPKAERPEVIAPQLPLKAHTAAIYTKKLPRVPQSTSVYDPAGQKEPTDKAQCDVAQSYPSHRKGLSIQATNISSQEPTARKSFNEALRYHANHGNAGNLSEDTVKITKVFLSEKQSGVVNELGIDLPCAPPVTPMPDILRRIEYVPSMYDIRAQRAVKSKLEILERQEIKRKEKLAAQQMKNDKISLKEKEKNRKKHQRLQIYALNKLMTEFEHNNFLQFCQANGIVCDL